MPIKDKIKDKTLKELLVEILEKDRMCKQDLIKLNLKLAEKVLEISRKIDK